MGLDGLNDGRKEGLDVIRADGDADGFRVGLGVGLNDGRNVGDRLGDLVGLVEGAAVVGLSDG